MDKKLNPMAELECKYKQQSSVDHVFKLADLPAEHYGNAGTMKLATKTSFPALEGVAVFWLSVDKDGLALPHWHPNTDELAYCIRGKGRMSVVSPSNESETKEFGTGDLVFFPRGHFHYIENLGDDKLEFLAIFNNELPDIIGINGALAGLPNSALATTFKVPAETFDQFEKEDTILTKKFKGDHAETT